MTHTRNDSDRAKSQAAEAAASLVKDGMSVGLGSGSTAALVVRALGKRVATEGLWFVGVPTSDLTADLARSLGIPLRELDDLDFLDINLDGADEIDPRFRMIKGRGGALLREKIVASFARRRVTVVTPEKQVEQLGVLAPIPVEVSPLGTRHVEGRLRALGADTTLRRLADGTPYLTDGGNKIFDCRFPRVDDPAVLDAALHQTVGVFETGLFIGLCDLLLVGHDDHVDWLEISAPPVVESPRAL
ncbi:MAG: ribose-5-phosphate isomerase RpiA [Isosphaeraceae bacterium]